MSKLFSPSAPAPVYVAPPPPSTDPSQNAASAKAIADAQAAEQQRAKGRAATYLTGGQGLTTQANVSRRTLIGI